MKMDFGQNIILTDMVLEPDNVWDENEIEYLILGDYMLMACVEDKIPLE